MRLALQVKARESEYDLVGAIVEALGLTAEFAAWYDNLKGSHSHLVGYAPAREEFGTKARDFAPDLHPRDWRGRFALKPGVARHKHSAPLVRALTELEGGKYAHLLQERPPEGPDEPDFAYQGRMLQGLPDELKNECLARVRARTRRVGYVVEAEKKWRKEHGLPEPRVDWDNVQASLEKAKRVTDEVDRTPGDPDNPDYRRAYEDFKRQNDEMWKVLTEDLGVKVSLWDERVQGRDDPYETAEDQAEDMLRNRHLWVNRGEFFLGTKPDSPTGTYHPFMSGDDYFRFRAVHDAFGHTGVGSGFDRHGEYAAWLAHNSMYTGDGRKAMSTEYHAVNSYLWYRGRPMPKEKYGIILSNESIANVYDADGNVVRKSYGDDVAAAARERVRSLWWDEAKERRVRTPGGERYFGRPVGSVIGGEPDLGGQVAAAVSVGGAMGVGATADYELARVSAVAERMNVRMAGVRELVLRLREFVDDLGEEAARLFDSLETLLHEHSAEVEELVEMATTIASTLVKALDEDDLEQKAYQHFGRVGVSGGASGARRVRTPQGARAYGQPIGSTIRRDADVPDLPDLDDLDDDALDERIGRLRAAMEDAPSAVRDRLRAEVAKLLDERDRRSGQKSSYAELEEKVRRVRSAAGVRKYGQPIGTVITEDMTPGAGRVTAGAGRGAAPEAARERAQRAERRSARARADDAAGDARTSQTMKPKKTGGGKPPAKKAPKAKPPKAKPANQTAPLVSGGYGVTRDAMEKRGDGETPMPKGEFAEGDPRNDPEYRKYVEQLNAKLDDLMRAGQDTMTANCVEDKDGNKVWTAARTKVHLKIIDDVMAQHEDVPSDRHAWMLGGLPGAGKSTFLRTHAKELGLEVDENGDPTNAVVVNPDEMKSLLLNGVDENGEPLVPVIEGLRKGEMSELVHEESSYLANMLAERVLAEGKNVVFDITLGDGEKARNKYLTNDRGTGAIDHDYNVTAAFVDTSLPLALHRAGLRHKQPNLTSGERGYSGRYVRYEHVLSQAPREGDGDAMSHNRVEFDALAGSGAFDHAIRYDSATQEVHEVSGADGEDDDDEAG